MSDRLETSLARARLKTPMNPMGMGLITYLMAGDPDSETTLRRLTGLGEVGVDILELGVPFSDPIADGSVIQSAGLRALQQGINLKKVLNLVARFRKENQDTPLLLMSYLNPLLHYGYDRFLNDAFTAGVDGLILPDLPWRESTPFRQRAYELLQDRLAFIPMIAQTSRPNHIHDLAQEQKGFVYVLSRNGITGGDAEIPLQTLQFIHSLQTVLSTPCYVGFGIQSSAQVHKLSQACQGVIVGSALVKKFAELDSRPLPEQELRCREQDIYTWIGSLRKTPVKEEIACE
ncbi:tryptophan synthase, alpha chain [Desulfitobacterium dehalogenans ATCC 51507]|uniref:Tryptophan synthase alpha chain n=1 Tax=Desulfitobacterium dehalogenans (strain ATCC 51507 / DSM 9161 / JW/IU-DC1) TaxID=756499 RepID=I4ADI6_DESDJ|nr:tryptophan synthase subunit alpha [Desulfitobacterium dehalogenans]AFM02021.1 tryptophan synthase, alpha chain [Desulfitobacterium dehalogenans ATCC 51507]